MTFLTDPTARRGFLLLSGGALLTLAGCSTTRPTPPVTTGAADETSGALPLVNALRAKHKLGSLSASKATAQAAQEQAVRMARAGEMKHLIGLGTTSAHACAAMTCRCQPRKTLPAARKMWLRPCRPGSILRNI